MLGGAESVAVQSELQACPPKKVALLGVLYGCGAVPVPVRLEGSEVAHPVVAENVAGHQKGHSCPAARFERGRFSPSGNILSAVGPIDGAPARFSESRRHCPPGVARTQSRPGRLSRARGSSGSTRRGPGPCAPSTGP